MFLLTCKVTKKNENMWKYVWKTAITLFCEEEEDGGEIVEDVESDAPPETEVDAVVGYGASRKKRHVYDTQHIGQKFEAVVAERYQVYKSESYGCQPDHRTIIDLLLFFPEWIGR